MADKPKYSSIIDEFLDAREPDWKDLGLKDAKSSGDEWLDRTHAEADVAFLDDIAEGASKHTAMPPTSKGATLQNRLLEKENAAPRLGSGRTAQTRTAGGGDDDASLFAEVTQSLESAEKGAKVEKKNRSEAEIQRYVKQLLNQGEAPSKVASQLKKLAESGVDVTSAIKYLQKNAGIVGLAYLEPHKVAEIELYNKGNNMSNAYLNNSDAGGTGADVLAPNTFMDGNNPNYERTAGHFDSQSDLKRIREQGGVLSTIQAGDRVTILIPAGRGRDGQEWKEATGRAVMLGPAGWVLNMGGAHGTPRIANEENIVKVHKKKQASEVPTSQDCVRQAKAWKAAGVTPRAKSVKQITACEDCSYFKKNGSTKSCGLYGLPVVGSASELASVVNKLTAGVPAKLKHAALVQIANRLPEQQIPIKQASPEAQFVRQASFTKERDYGFHEAEHFNGSHIQKLHTAGHSLKVICAAADKKFGALETSKAVREFVASLRKEKGKIVVAKADADYLKKIGIHNEAIVGAAKCASCKAHNDKELHKAASTDMVTRAPETFVQATPASIRSSQKKVVANFDSAVVAKYHAAGHSVDKIFKAASAKYGSAQASKAVRDWANNLKNTNTKIALSQIDCTTLNKMGVKLSSKNAILGAEKCGSCSFRNGMHCGLTGGTLLSFPGMNQIASNKKVASGAPEDGRSILNEFDLMGSAPQADIDMKAPDRAEIQMGSTLSAGDIE